MNYTLTRNGEDYDLDLYYDVTDFVPAHMRDEGLLSGDLYTIEIIGAWCDGEEFHLTDAEREDAEVWIHERVEI